MKVRELLKALVYVIWNVCYEIFQQAWKPLLSTLIKTLLITTFVFLSIKYIPHNIPAIRDINYLGWFTIICVYRLISFKYDDFSDEEPAPDINDTSPDIDTEPEIEDEPKQPTIQQQPMQNVKMKENSDGTSTRE